MSPEKFALCVAIAVFAAGTVGLVLQRVLPEKFTTGGPRDMIGAVVGLLTLLSALVLGLLIWTAYGVYAGQNLAVQTLAAKVLQLDLALADYGPDATPLRATGPAKPCARRSTRSGERKRATPLSSPRISPRRSRACATGTRPWPNFIPRPTPRSRRLPPRTSISRGNRPVAIADVVCAVEPGFLSVHPDRSRMGDGLFCGYGLMSKGNPMSIAVGAVGAIAIASAVYLILDLSNPYSGPFRASSAAARAGAGDHGQGVGNLIGRPP